MANVTNTKALTLEGVKAVGAAAEAEAAKNGWKVAIAVVDAGGYPLYLARMDGAPVASFKGAQAKAWTAATFGRPTKMLDDGIAAGRTQMLAFPDMLPIEGGVPVVVDGQTIGAIGVGGATAAQDGQIAQAGVAALGR